MDKKCMYCMHISQFFDGCNLPWECKYEPNFIAHRFIEELEKIKSEIKDEEYSTNWLVSADVEKGWNEAVEYAIGKIDNYIEELKGENNE